MNHFQSIEIPQVSISENGVPVTSSLEVARFFEKEHKNILQSIENLKIDLPIDFNELNFQLSLYKQNLGQGEKELPMYNLTRDAFTLLAMGFTGKRALQFKLAYIEAFNRMEQALLAQKQNLLNTQQVKAVESPKPHIDEPQIFPTHIINMAKRIKEILWKNESNEYLTPEELKGFRGLINYQSILNKVPAEELEKILCEGMSIRDLSVMPMQDKGLATALLWRGFTNIKGEGENTEHYKTLYEALANAFLLLDVDKEGVEKLLKNVSGVTDITKVPSDEFHKVEFTLIVYFFFYLFAGSKIITHA